MSIIQGFDSAGTHKYGLTLDGIECKTVKKVDLLLNSYERSK